MQKDEIADILKEIGVFLELKGENPFKTRAYQNGARTLEGLTEPLEVLIEEERLGKCVPRGSPLRRGGSRPGESANRREGIQRSPRALRGSASHSG